jgi:hypothetical protein
MMIVDVKRLQEAVDYIAIVNSVNLDQIEWRKDNKQIHVEPETIDEWRFVGLSNVTFAKQTGIVDEQ